MYVKFKNIVLQFSLILFSVFMKNCAAEHSFWSVNIDIDKAIERCFCNRNLFHFLNFRNFENQMDKIYEKGCMESIYKRIAQF